MSCDRVIQDSDEDEPYVENDVAKPIGFLQYHETPMRQHHEPYPAMQQADYSIDQLRDMHTTEAQSSIKFDQYLESQENVQPINTSPRHQREERWIPQTSESGGSIGVSLLHCVSIVLQRSLGSNLILSYQVR